MAPEFKQRLSLNTDLQLRSPITQGLLDLAPAELELLLDQSLEAIKEFHKENPGWSAEHPSAQRKNFLLTKAFRDLVSNVKKSVPLETIASEPQVIVEPSGAMVYNPEIQTRLREKLAKFTRDAESVDFRDTFAGFIGRQHEWTVTKQKRVVEYLLAAQSDYVQSGETLDLQEVNQRQVADYLGVDVSTVSRLVKNLTVQLPNGKIIFVKEFMRGAATQKERALSMLKELRKDPKWFDPEKRKWRVPSHVLADIFEKMFSMRIARRTMAKYKGLLEEDQG